MPYNPRADKEVSPSPPWIAYADLLRMPAALVAAGLALGGSLLAGARLPTVPALTAACLAAGALAATASAFHDLFDLETDRRDQPARPLPSGRISPQRAQALAWSLLASGLLLATIAGRDALLIALGVALAHALHETLRPHFLGASFLLSAAAFTGSLWLGIATVPYALLAFPLPLVTVLLYGLALSVLHSPLAAGASPAGPIFVALLHFLSAVGLLLYQGLADAFNDPFTYWPFLIALFVAIAPVLLRLQLTPTPPRVRVAYQTTLIATFWLGAALAAGYQGLFAGFLVGLLYFPALVFAHRLSWS